MKKITLLLALFISCTALGQNATVAQVDSVNQKVDTLLEEIKKKKKKVQFGFSIGYRQAFSIGEADKFLAEASISPIDSTLQVELINRHSFLVSAIISVYPFDGKTEKWNKDLGFYANINLAEIASDGNFESIFNQQIEGGMGLTYRLSEDFAIGAGYEFIFHRRIRDYVFNSVGDQIVQRGNVLTELDESDDSLFRSDNVHAWSVKFIFYL
ncbi:MAG: hypothetical protein AAF489_00385 [Bacteroidota bacterium]